MIQIIVENSFSQIRNLDDIALIDMLSKRLSYTTDAARYSYNFRVGAWNGVTKLLGSTLKFPSGLLSEVTSFFNQHSVVFQIDDRRSLIFPNANISWAGPTLYDYQNDVVDKALSAKRGMIKVGTGGGKSIIISKITAELNQRTVIYVVSLDLLTQIKNTLEECLQIPIGIVGNGMCDIRQVTVCSCWTAGKAYAVGDSKKDRDDVEEDIAVDKWSPSENQRQMIREMVESATVIMLDEAQFAAAFSIRTILKNSKSASQRFGFSGTPWRTGGDDLLLVAAFGENICDVSASQLIRAGYLVQPKIAFRDIPIPSLPIKKDWREVKQNYIVENAVRNELLIKNTLKLLEMGRKPLLLFRELSHGKTLERMLPDGIHYRKVTGNLSGAERDTIRNDFKMGMIDLILASSVYDQGVDLPGLDALILCSGGKSTAKALQRVGRVIRGSPGKKDALIVETFDQTHYVKQHSIKRFAIYKTEDEFAIKCGPEMQKIVSKTRIE